MLSARQIRRLLVGFACIAVIGPGSVSAQRRLSFRPGMTSIPRALSAASAASGTSSLEPAPPGHTVRTVQGSSPEAMPSVAEDVRQLDEVVEGDEWIDTGVVVDGDGHVGSCDGCADCSGCDCGDCGVPVGSWLSNLSVFGGAHGFKNDANRGADGSFGFHYGLNYGTAARNIILPPSVGWQVGVQFANSNLNAASFTFDERNQIFLTAGLYRRGDFGLQGGLVVDYLWDDWYFDSKLNVGQVRGEIGLATTPSTSLGFEFAASIRDQVALSRTLDGDEMNKWRTKDQFRFFYRTRMYGGGRGECQLYAGFSGHSDGIIGGRSKMPLQNGWAVETDYTYLIPSESRRGGANEFESWNIALNLVWYPGSLACGSNRYHRPLFDVANNGSMIIRRERD